jgi:hypothetical protein
MAESTKIVTSAPMSFSGSLKRTRNWFSGWMFWLVGLPLVLLWWIVILAWYVCFGLLLVPYRLVRRGSRKRKLADARHAEVLSAVRHTPQA